MLLLTAYGGMVEGMLAELRIKCAGVPGALLNNIPLK